VKLACGPKIVASMLVALSALALGACGPGDRPGDGSGDDDGSDRPDANTGPGDVGGQDEGTCTKVDFLFVVDNSPSMGDEQAALIANFPKFIQVIDAFKTNTGKPLDYRIAVTTTGRNITYTVGALTQTEMGDDGVFHALPGMTRPWIERADGNVTGAFSQLANVGTTGPSWEMQLKAAELAFTRQAAPGKPNAGFLRDDALLAMVLITDEDDCSRDEDMWTSTGFDYACKRDPDTFVQFFDQLKGERGRWASTVIAIPPGTGEPCVSGSASTGDRLKDFVTAAGQNSVFADICTGNFASALDLAVGTFTAACQSFPPIK
jgi:hypothetical protein